MTHIHEKSEKLRDKLAAIKGWATYKKYLSKGVKYYSDEYGLASVAYKENSTSIKTSFYFYEHNYAKGWSTIEKYNYTTNQWEHVEFGSIEKTLDSILETLEQSIKNTRFLISQNKHNHKQK